LFPGQTASDPDGNVVGPGDLRAQARYVFEKMKRSVEAAGGTLDDIVSMTVLVTDARYFAAVNEARREIITANFPSSTMVQVTAFGRPEMLVEMNAIAVVPDGTR
jgi:enamine deaminase RidA (YjgF/YER057c/UK114 family)